MSISLRKAVVLLSLVGAIGSTHAVGVLEFMVASKLVDLGLGAVKSAVGVPPPSNGNLTEAMAKEWSGRLNAKLPMDWTKTWSIQSVNPIAANVLEIHVKTNQSSLSDGLTAASLGRKKLQSDADTNLVPQMRQAFCQAKGFWPIWLQAGGTLIVRVEDLNNVSIRSYKASQVDCGVPRR